jgi:hypothetical protein
MLDYDYALVLCGSLLMVIAVCVVIYVEFFMPIHVPVSDLETGSVRRRRVLGVFGLRAQVNAGRRAGEAPTVEYVELQQLPPVYRVPEHGQTPPTYEEAVLGHDSMPT